MRMLGLTRSVPAMYGPGETLVAHLGHPMIAWPASDDDVSILCGCYTFAV